MSDTPKYPEILKETTGYELKIKLSAYSDSIHITLNREGVKGVNERWQMLFHRNLLLTEVAQLLQAVFNAEDLGIKCISILVDTKNECVINKSEKNSVDDYIETLANIVTINKN